MASPFRLFRKYMKPMMVVLCGMAMLAFVVVDPLMQYLSAGSRGGAVGQDGTQVVVTWKDGQITENELHSLVVRRNVLDAFIRAVFVEGYVAAQQEGAEDLGLTVQPLQLITDPSQVEQDVVRTQVFADAARRMGMTISDEQVTDYLDKLGRNRVSFEQMKMILDSMSSQRRITSQFILDATRDELLKQNYLSSYQFAVNTVMPDERWTDWLRANDRVIVEAAALKTSDYVDQVPEPTDAQIREFYEKYKDREVRPEFQVNTLLPSAEPGFQIPRKVTLQYLEGNYDAFLQKLMDSISEEQIAKYYEENKEYFIKAGSGAAAEAAPAKSPPMTDTPEGAAPSDDAANELFEVPKTPQPESAEKTPTEPAAPESPGPESASPPDGQSSHGSTKSPFRLAGLQDKASSKEPAVEEAQQPEPPAETETAATTPKPAAETATESPAEGEAKAKAEDAPAAAESAESKPVEYQSLDEVRDAIRRRLAGDKVNEQLRQTMERLLGELNSAYLSYFDKQLTARSSKKTEPDPPAMLQDLQPLAEPNGLAFHKTEELSFWELRDLPIGRSVEPVESTDRQFPLVLLVFGRLKNYEPVVTHELGNRYLVVKTSDTLGRVPPLKEIRDQVVAAWKRQKASELALAAAKKAAEQIEKDGISVGDKFTNDPKVEIAVTDPFTWLTTGDISPTNDMVQFKLSDAAPIVAAGPDFMRTVFQLGDGEVGAVLNNDHSIAYVVRVQQHLESRDELQQDFLSEAFRWYGAQTMQQDHRQNAILSLFDGLLKQADVDWKRPPDQVSQSDG